MSTNETSAGQHPPTPLRILLVEDSKHDRLAFHRAFKKSQIPVEITAYERAETALEQLKAGAASFDLRVTDYKLPGMSGLELYREFLKLRISLPLVILTGTGTEYLVVEALKAGVDDYIIKDPTQGYLELLQVVLPDTVQKHSDRLARQRTEKALQESQQLLEKTFASLLDAVFIIAADTVEIVDCNLAASEIFGYSREEMLNRATAFLHVDEATLEEFRTHLYPAVEERGFLFMPEFRMKRKDGTAFPIEHSVMPLEDEQGKRIGWVSVVRDITERKRAEETLRQYTAQLEALREVGLELTAQLDLDTLLYSIASRAFELLGETSGGLYLY